MKKGEKKEEEKIRDLNSRSKAKSQLIRQKGKTRQLTWKVDEEPASI